MTVLSYMGTKAALVPAISAVFASLPEGPLLELFAGMSAVGRSVADVRPLWTNDVQVYSNVVCQFQFLTNRGQPSLGRSVEWVASQAEAHSQQLERARFPLFEQEREALASGIPGDLITFEETLRVSLQGTAAPGSDKLSYELFTAAYPGTYFSLKQCSEIDGLRRAIDILAPPDDIHLQPTRRRMLSALGAVMLRASNTTGHFAQYIRLSQSNYARVKAKRRRSVIAEWALYVTQISAAGSEKWRQGNKVFNSDAETLVASKTIRSGSVSIVYADPPYTSDHYSRFYHLLETMVLYDYPPAKGAGMYREDRFVSDWSLKTKVRLAFERLIDGVADIGSALVISYPEQGLLADADKLLPDLLRKRFTKVSVVSLMPHRHSTMGASKGRQNHRVQELLFVAENAA